MSYIDTVGLIEKISFGRPLRSWDAVLRRTAHAWDLQIAIEILL